MLLNKYKHIHRLWIVRMLSTSVTVWVMVLKSEWESWLCLTNLACRTFFVPHLTFFNLNWGWNQVSKYYIVRWSTKNVRKQNLSNITMTLTRILFKTMTHTMTACEGTLLNSVISWQIQWRRKNLTLKTKNHYKWLVKVTLVVAFGFLLQNFGRWLGPMNVICHSVNVDGVVVLFGGGGNTSALHVVIEIVWTFMLDVVRHLNPTCCNAICTQE